MYLVFLKVYNQPYVFLKYVNQSCAFISGQVLVTVDQPALRVRNADTGNKTAGAHSKTTHGCLTQTER